MNTINKLGPPYVFEFDEKYLIMQVRKNSKESNIYLWDIKIFEKINENNLYKLNQEVIRETSFKISMVRNILTKH